MSGPFYAAFYKQQELQMGKSPSECMNLIQEVSTRYIILLVGKASIWIADLVYNQNDSLSS